MSDIVDEAKEDYQETKQSHEELKDALVAEHGSTTTEVDFGNGVTAEVDSSPGVGRIKQIQHLANKLDGDVDGSEFINNLEDWCEGVAALIVDDEWDADLLVGIAEDDITAFKEVLSRILEAMDLENMEVDEDTLKSFRGE